MDSQKKAPLIISVRAVVSILAFFAYFIMNSQRANMGITILCMFDDNPNSFSNKTDNFTFDDTKTQSTSQNNWNVYILISYFCGHILTQIFGGVLAFKYGTKIVLSLSILTGSIGTLLTPVVSTNNILLIICRFFIGFVHGATFPAISTIWIYWCPISERSRLVGFALSGVHTGNAVVNLVGGTLCKSKIGGLTGWPFVYYIFGVIGVIWTIVFWLIYQNSPKDHKFISKREQKYLIDETIEFVQIIRKINNQKFPWKSIFLSKSINCIFVANFAFAWGNYFFITKLSAYVFQVLKFDIVEIGESLSYSFFGTTICMIIVSIISDKLLKYVKKIILRKIFNSLGLFIPMVCLIGVIFATSKYIAISLLIIGITFNGCISSGFLVNINDLCGHYSGVVFGISNTFATIPGIVGPFLINELLKNYPDDGWTIFFIITIVIYFIGGVSFIIFASSNILSWAKIKNENTPIEELSKKDSNKVYDQDIVFELQTRF